MTQRQHTAARLGLGALAGGIAGTAGILAGQAAAAVLPGVTGPVLAVGNRAVDWAPRPLKEFAIETFGDADKIVLIGGVLVTVGLLILALGAVGTKRPRAAVIGFSVLIFIASLAMITDRAATAGVGLRFVAVLATAVVGIGGFIFLLKAWAPARVAPSNDGTSEDPSALSFDRRAFLVAASAVAAVGAAGGVVSRALGGGAAAASREAIQLPAPASPVSALPDGVTFELDGLTPYLTDNADFYRVDTALEVPDVPLEGYVLRIHGMVDNPIELTFEDLLNRDLIERRVTLTCVSNPVGGDYVGNATWLGVPMKELLAEADVQDGADAVKSTSADDFTAGTPLSVLTDDREAMIAIGMNGEPLPLEHGFPVRMVTPGLYGYVSATKWLVDLEVTRFADFTAYWTDRGYSALAPIKLSSRIDVPRSFAQLNSDDTVVGGVAWAQDEGIDRVEVRVDEGEWSDAELGVEDNDQTWRPWRWDWSQPTSGLHRLEVRATDRAGNTQTSQREPIAPNGSTGWHNVTVTVS
ncbi:molybdopterin-dependent oxidoreductase [Ornithinimicrobium sp. INDO-MA30-4]|uniref:molybdopterin-dependent oxidoreductase n=1 Tax=Ornithinimicrobium sp. INDO-MA30-4 TaxID=2908651 RepID=UPI001F47D344|nr:molybdopterin-dependent oxidoreductase [Ornithinimicrobium sp. INDO-MA30-4]UJH70880.1 molybdopterin-dependent oxidoreductase [Ornithinimicrobium sp. INDO-MA30-4]